MLNSPDLAGENWPNEKEIQFNLINLRNFIFFVLLISKKKENEFMKIVTKKLVMIRNIAKIGNDVKFSIKELKFTL